MVPFRPAVSHYTDAAVSNDLSRLTLDHYSAAAAVHTQPTGLASGPGVVPTLLHQGQVMASTPALMMPSSDASTPTPASTTVDTVPTSTTSTTPQLTSTPVSAAPVAVASTLLSAATQSPLQPACASVKPSVSASAPVVPVITVGLPQPSIVVQSTSATQSAPVDGTPTSSTTPVATTCLLYTSPSPRD